MRKERDYKVERPGRDLGKVFHLTEMPAAQAQKWSWRALGAMARAGMEVPQHIINLGMPGVLAMGLKAILGAEWRDAEPLLDELMACVRRVEDNVQNGRELVDSDIEEPITISLLQSEVIELHTGFSVAAYLLKLWEQAAENTAQKQGSSPPIPT